MNWMTQIVKEVTSAININSVTQVIQAITSLIIAYCAYKALNIYKKYSSIIYSKLERNILITLEKIYYEIKSYDLFKDLDQFEECLVLCHADNKDYLECKKLTDNVSHKSTELTLTYSDFLPTLKQKIFQLKVITKTENALIIDFDKMEKSLFQYTRCLNDIAYAMLCLYAENKYSKFYNNYKIVFTEEINSIKNTITQISINKEKLIDDIQKYRI
jgi:hypothetical protein